MPPNRQKYHPQLSGSQILNLPELPPPPPIRRPVEKILDPIYEFLKPAPKIMQSMAYDQETGLPNVDLGAVVPATPMILELLKRYKKGEKASEIAFKTIKKFVNEKIAKNPSWETGELVPTRIAKTLREVNRNIEPKYPGHLKDVKNWMLDEGMSEMGRLNYNPENRMVHLGEGNTRTTLSDNLNIPFVPLTGRRSIREPYIPNNVVIPEINPFSGGRVPAEFKPSDLGFDVFDTDELIDIISKIRANK